LSICEAQPSVSGPERPAVPVGRTATAWTDQDRAVWGWDQLERVDSLPIFGSGPG